MPVEDRLARALDERRVGRVDLEHAELPLDEVDPRLDLGHGLEREVDDALDREAGRDLDDQRVLALDRRVAAGAQRRAEVGRELPGQVRDRQVDAELDLSAHLTRRLR